MKRVGYSVPEKLVRKFKLDEFRTYCRNVGIELVELDLDRPLCTQGPFDLIFHKMVDHISRAEKGDVTAKERVLRFDEYVKAHPDVILMDPLESVVKLLDRKDQYQNAQNDPLFQNNPRFIMPAFVKLTTSDVATNKRLLEQAGVKYPFVCKPSIAHGFRLCHKMSIIFNDEGLKDVQPPCVAVTFLNHNALLYKIYVIGHHYFVSTRPSIKNFQSCDRKTIYFDSGDVCKSWSTSHLSMMDDDDPAAKNNHDPDPQKFEQIAIAVQNTFNLTLFGVDVIIEESTGRYAVIDINSVPGFYGIDFFEVMSDVLIRSIERGRLVKIADFNPVQGSPTPSKQFHAKRLAEQSPCCQTKDVKPLCFISSQCYGQSDTDSWSVNVTPRPERSLTSSF